MTQFITTLILLWALLIPVTTTAGKPDRDPEYTKALTEPRPAYRRLSPGVAYAHVNVALKDNPFIYDVLKINLGTGRLHLGAIQARGRATVASMVEYNRREGFSIVAAINADFFHGHRLYGIHVQQGELVWPPSTKCAFMIDAGGKPRVDVIKDSRVRLRIDDGPWQGVAGINRWKLRRADKGRPIIVSSSYTLRNNYGRAPRVPLGGGIGVFVEGLFPLVGKTVSGRVTHVQREGSAMSFAARRGSLIVWQGKAARRRWWRRLTTNTTITVDVTMTPAVREAVGGGPRLVRDGKVGLEFEQEFWGGMEQSWFKSPAPRVALGLNRTRDTVYLLKVEGRTRESVGLNLEDLGALLVGLGSWDALNFDGGNSSMMWTPTFNLAGKREIPNGLAVYLRD